MSSYDDIKPLRMAMVDALESATDSGHLTITDMRTIGGMERRGLVQELPSVGRIRRWKLTARGQSYRSNRRF